MTLETETDSILGRLHDEARGEPAIEPLADADYMRCHVAFEGASTQQDKIFAWLLDRLTEASPSQLSLTGVGTGSGILDAPLIERLAEHQPVRYRAIEPIQEQCETFRRELEALNEDERVDADVLQARVEDAEVDEASDFVLAIHSIYTMDDPAAAIDRMLGWVRPEGELILAVAPVEAMNRLSQVFWRGEDKAEVAFAEDVEAGLARAGHRFEATRIDATLDLPCDAFEPDADSAVLDFLTQARFRSMPESVQGLVRRYLEEVSVSGDACVSLSHPVTLFRVAARA